MEKVSDNLRIDGHKLMFHPERISDWMEGKNIYPIYVEIAPVGFCNHACTFCACDFMGYQRRFLDKDVLQDRLAEMAEGGVKSVMYAGEGEPLLHKGMADIVNFTKESGIDVSFTTNAVALTPRFTDQALKDISWIKTSIAAGTPETYAKIHQTKPEDFNRVISNLSYAAQLRRERGLGCTLGAQLMLLPENVNEAETLASITRDAGLDYLVIKPYSQHPMSVTNKYEGIKYSDYLWLGEALEKYKTPDFNVVFRQNTMLNLESEKRGYDRCYGLPFWAYIDAGGDMWGCSVYLSDERFRYGNIYENTFKEIWEGERRMNNLRWVENELDASECRKGCHMDHCNRYLWELRHPHPHANFI